STLCLTGSSLGQSCSLPSVTLTPTYRRSLISPLQSVINALLNGQLVLDFPQEGVCAAHIT
ncbi:MAG: hypothetical protein J6A24_01255, partial [Clostridia bacterium]|nr:hypothetical protein [Clostridia bacterium]